MSYVANRETAKDACIVFSRRMFLLLFVVVLVVPRTLMAQLSVVKGSDLSLQGWTADSLVRNVMLGEGVEVFNVKFNGGTSISCTGVGTFSYEPSSSTAPNLGISSGIVLACCELNYLNSGGNMTSSCSNANDSNLAAIVSPKSLNNCVVLEFDFIPLSDSIKFRYVFASEEYHGYECTQFNDVFAFFISGVNPVNGGYYTNKNIALVPGTETPISISTVNGGETYGTQTPCITTNTEYFVDNTLTIDLKHLDGFTSVLTAMAKVAPCQTYHLKMAISNVTDCALPSAVFLEANSLSSSPIMFEFVNPSNPSDPTNIYEGCSATIKMSRATQFNNDILINVAFEGEAVNGVDFEQWDTSFWFPDTALSVSKTLFPFLDFIEEGNGTSVEMCRIVLSTDSTCPIDNSAEFNILDVDSLVVSIVHDTLTAWSDSVVLSALITGGLPEKAIVWTNVNSGEVWFGDSIAIATVPDSRWICEVTDSCYNYASDTVQIGIRCQFVSLLHDTAICDGQPLKLVAHYNNAYGATASVDSCVWYKNGMQQPFEIFGDTVIVTPHTTTQYILHAFLFWNGQYWESIDTVNVIVVPIPILNISVSSEHICQGDMALFTVSGADRYSWDGGETFENSNVHTFFPDSTAFYVIYGLNNGAECYNNDSVLIEVDSLPTVSLTGTNGVCAGESTELTAVTDAETFVWSSSPHDPTLEGQESHSYILVEPLKTTAYTLHAVAGACTNSVSMTVHVDPTPVAIGTVSPYTVSLGAMEATFTDRSLHATSRLWRFEDGETRTEPSFTYLVPDDVDALSVLLIVGNTNNCMDSTTVTVNVDRTTLWAPNAFTPGENSNNTFEVKVNDILNYQIYIYDRSGLLVFESRDPERPWDGTAPNGKICPHGVYTYIITGYKVSSPKVKISYRGTVLLIR